MHFSVYVTSQLFKALKNFLLNHPTKQTDRQTVTQSNSPGLLMTFPGHTPPPGPLNPLQVNIQTPSASSHPTRPGVGLASCAGRFKSSRPWAFLEECFIECLPTAWDSCSCQPALREDTNTGGMVERHLVPSAAGLWSWWGSHGAVPPQPGALALGQEPSLMSRRHALGITSCLPLKPPRPGS